MDWRKLTKLFHWKSGSIRRRLLTWGLTLFGLALIISTLAGSLYTRRLIKKEAAGLQKEIALRVAEEIEDFVRRKVDRLSDLAASASLDEMGSETQRLLALLLLKNDQAYTEVSILDDKGMEVVKVSERRVYLPAEFSDQSGSDKFAKAMKGESYISPVYTSDRAEPYITVAVPLKITPRTVVGVVTAEANLKSLWEVIGEIAFGRAGYAYLVDGQGNLIAHRDPSLVLKRTSLAHIHAVQEFLRHPSGTDSSPAQEGRGIINKPVLSTFVPVSGLGWAVILEEPVHVALAEVRRLERYAVLLLAAVLLMGAAAIVWASDRITKPIRELHRGAEIIAAGDLDYRAQIRTGDEIEELGEQFNRMAMKLKTSYATLEQRVESRTRELSALYDVTATASQSLEAEQVLQQVIKKIIEIFGFDTTRIFLFDDRRESLDLRASFETDPEFWMQVRHFVRGQGFIGRVAESGAAVVIENVWTDPRYQQISHTKATQRAGLSFLSAFPIKAREKTLGTMLCQGREPRHLAPEDVRLLTSMAEQIGVAIQNANLFGEVKQKTAELERANQELIELSRAKSEFMAAMSHELRTPLNVIIGNADLIRDRFFGEITPKQRDSLEKILRYSQMLLKLINDVLAMTRLEAKKMSMDVSTFHLEDVVDHVQTFAEQLNYNHNLKMLWEVEKNLPPITTDALKLEEILQNLIGNAFKFTLQGTIEVRVRDLPGKGRVEFSVADTGIGIEREGLDKIFDEFYQQKDAHTGSHSGVGLGLSIVKKYLEMMQGEIRVESEPQKGSTFTFTFPYAIANAK
ncbi:MAG: GAF domain-containing protein [Deltaproteobacteria bacterium]|nr:GAF domain-containing protein [Deltaproteobacteria bacterium]